MNPPVQNSIFVSCSWHHFLIKTVTCSLAPHPPTPNTRKNFARPKSEVEAEIAKQRPAPPAKKEAAKPSAESLAPPSANEAASPSHPEQPTQAAEEQTPPPPAEVSPPAQQPSLSPGPGRGGPEHKALQAFVKQLAEGFNFRVTIEEPVLDGKGHVDLSLERDACRIAVEISITTPVDKEVQNLRKCLDAGFDPVIMLAPDYDRLGKIRSAAEATFEPSELRQLHFCLSEEVSQVLQQFASAESDSEGVIHKGYAVKATFKEMGETETQSKRRTIRKTIGAALRKLGDK